MPRTTKTSPSKVVEDVSDNESVSSIDSLPTASEATVVLSKKDIKKAKEEREARSIEDILEALDYISKTAHELRIDLKKVKKLKGAKTAKKGSFPKGETPPQTKAWNDYVKTVHDDMKSKADEGEKVLYKHALQEAKRRRDAGESHLPPSKKKSSKNAESVDFLDKGSNGATSEKEPVKSSHVSDEAKSSQKEEPVNKYSKKSKKSDEPVIEDGELVVWEFNGTEYLRSAAGELWLNKDGEMGKWAGLYDSKTKKIDKKAKEPEVDVE